MTRPSSPIPLVQKYLGRISQTTATAMTAMADQVKRLRLMTISQDSRTAGTQVYEDARKRLSLYRSYSTLRIRSLRVG